jgi:hypothetical protein
MQTLNVGAGRTDQEYKDAGKRRLADLRTDSQADANYFFWAAGVAALGTGLLPIRLNFLVNIGAIDLFKFYGGGVSALKLYCAFGAWLIVLAALGFAARHGYRFAFLLGMILYGADMIALIVTFSLWAFGVHAFFVFRWFQGQKALKDLHDASGFSAAPSPPLQI